MHGNHLECDEDTIYFYSPRTVPPALNKYTKLISDLLQNSPIIDALPGGAPEAIALCQDAKTVLEKESVVLDIDVTERDDLIIAGDIHGQFADLLHNVLSMQLMQRTDVGVSSKTLGSEYKFLFLGDYVDRGPRSVEVITLLLALKIEYPAHVFLLRGNHEEAQTCRVYGFFQECRVKLEGSGRGIGGGSMNMSGSAWLHYNMVFCWLPLAAVVRCPAGMFFCAHGGLSPKTNSIAGLKSLRRNEYGQLLEASSSLYFSSPTNDNDGELSSADEGIIVDGLLWSDPNDEVYGFQINHRGCGFIFGPDATKKFLDLNYGYSFKSRLPGEQREELQFVVRAHQCVEDGYHWVHGGLVLTLFSAPRYCGLNNKGAFAVLRGRANVGRDRVFFEYKVYDIAPTLPNGMLRLRTSSDAAGAADAVRGLNDMILSDYFQDNE
ncbi:putative serine/threonine-protein phosphatase 2A, catalytic subunit [Trypanosoma rangeli]|uniref:Serine/threonine-protein phosphatase n=1 Tax=Trypanosoma rangeli TaxID=5698 RepID=A0A3R7M399_TRYRA|nr:putative serine/threonine-protein phosphatase 2A, catalytic subunit [Trypanosoma rangeli]RNF08243.1 putative serine/threonine-protein phosphatase 2A, catalytic subunit [Trypanosoma rangeli]|eukprot:RNF08243.1 putative serine/threonine-protein phosphatase 2A, catalytic subunit [Trypanosoma rangeli]